MNHLLEQLFKTTASRYTENQSLSEKLWREVEKNYSEKKRYYHNLSHLENLYSELSAARTLIEDWDTTVFALFYHDIIYRATANDNEEKSAALAKIRLQEIGYPFQKIEKCEQLILATKGHTLSTENDINLFTDADLSVLGKPWPVFDTYCHNVRREYSIYPDFLYNPGRKKVLVHFQGMHRIFKTSHFYDLYEAQARENLKKEIAEL
jgi:predicted metal-dependent HD superfamily phosphohydrolase